MSYEDTVRVAELKIRPSRFARVREEAKVEDGQILEIAEFFHPRTQEIADTLPAALGRWLMRTGWARGLVDRFTRKGRIVKTTSIGGFALLYLLASLKPLRRRSLRFATEQAALTRLARSCRRYRPIGLYASPSRSRAPARWSRATATRMSAGRRNSESSWRSCRACADNRTPPHRWPV